jgi:hypothetical protein
MGAQKKVGF